MICPKCKRKYEDDMPKCLWCDAPNPNYGKHEQGEADADVAETDAEDTVPEQKPIQKQESAKSKNSSTAFFWLTLLLGHAGYHCFKSGRTAQGILYLLLGGFTYKLVYHLLEGIHVLCPAILTYISFICSPVISILVAKDLWLQSLGKYRNNKTGRIYPAKSWMPAMAAVGTILFVFMEVLPVNYIHEAVWDNGRISSGKMEATVNAYLQAQSDYFKKTGKIGTQDQLHFIKKNLDIVRIDGYIYRLYGATLDITYMANFHCPAKSKWQVTPSVQNGELTWEIQTPADPRCNKMLPLLSRAL